jgi:hypothetical protein
MSTQSSERDEARAEVIFWGAEVRRLNTVFERASVTDYE